MPTLEQAREHERTVRQITTLAMRDLSTLWLAVQSQDADQVRDALIETLGPTLLPYAADIADLAAVFYDDLREQAGVRGRYLAEPADLPDDDRFATLARWGVGPLWGVTSGNPLERIAGGAQRLLANSGRDTIYANAQADPADVRYQRVPSSGCCAFCGLMASRGGDYRSKRSAEFVVGRGLPVETTRGRRGGQARGLRPRGTRQIGQKFHDDCRCTVTAVFAGQSQQLPPNVKRFADAYDEAPPGADLKTALASMRSTLGTR